MPEDTVANYIAAGRLQVVLEAWFPPFAGYYLYYPSCRQNAPAFKAILDALRYSAA